MHQFVALRTLRMPQFACHALLVDARYVIAWQRGTFLAFEVFARIIKGAHFCVAQSASIDVAIGYFVCFHFIEWTSFRRYVLAILYTKTYNLLSSLFFFRKKKRELCCSKKNNFKKTCFKKKASPISHFAKKPPSSLWKEK